MASMLDCEKIQPQLSEYIDGAVEGDDAAWAIKLHLASCAVCSQVVGELTQTTRLLRDLPSMETSAGFEAALARRLADQVLQPRRPSLLARWSEWWSAYRPAPRIAFASAGAFATVAAVSLTLFVHHSGAPSSLAHGIAAPQQTAVMARGNTPLALPSDPALNELWNEHISYASSEPLADSSADMLEGPTGVASSSIASTSGNSPL